MFFTHIKNITLLKKKLLNILQFAINKTTIMGGKFFFLLYSEWKDSFFWEIYKKWVIFISWFMIIGNYFFLKDSSYCLGMQGGD